MIFYPEKWTSYVYHIKYHAICEDLLISLKYTVKDFLLLEELRDTFIKPKILVSQTTCRRPINAPVPGRCY